MISKEISLFSIFPNTQSSLLAFRCNGANAVRLKNIASYMFDFLQCTGNILIDLTISNNPSRLWCNTIYYIFQRDLKHFYLSVLVQNRKNILTSSTTYSSALILERECFEMFGVRFDNHPDLRKLLLDYSFVGNPLKKDFPLSGFHILAYSTNKIITTKNIYFVQSFRNYKFENPWIN